jgi:tetratricopeptide (TPR) repeat protein
MEANDPAKLFRSEVHFATVYLSAFQFDKSLEYGYRALSLATIHENDERKAESFLIIARTLQGQNQFIHAFRNYLNGIQIAEKLHHPGLLGAGYSDLSKFYLSIKSYSKARHYNLKKQEVILQEYPVDSVAFFWNLYELQVIDMESGVIPVNEVVVRRILGFAKREDHRRMTEFGISMYRSHLIEDNRIADLRNFYLREATDEWKRLPQDNPGLYLRLKAFFTLEDNLPDSASYYFRKAEQVVKTDPNKLLQSKFYQRYGSFLHRTGNIQEALKKYSVSYDLAREASYFSYMLDAAQEMELIYSEKGDFKEAYRTALLRKSLSDSLDNLTRREQILTMEVDHETRQRELMAEKELQRTERRHNLQYMAMVIAILTAFVVLIMLGSLKVSARIIRMLGFFSFIFLFEFIILLADHKIHHMTHGEPWKIILIKIALIAVLLPFHHWIEKKVIAYLLSHRLITISKISILERFRKKSTAANEDHA